MFSWLKIIRGRKIRQSVFLFTYIFSGIFFSGKAQTSILSGCVDSNRINQYFQCFNPTQFQPMCACGITYFNQCIAENVYGVRPNIVKQGVCSTTNFEFFFYPNLASTDVKFPIDFWIQFREQTNNSAQLIIFDVWGRNKYAINNVPLILPDQAHFQIPEISNFQTGIYYVMITVNGESKIKKLLFVASQ